MEAHLLQLYAPFLSTFFYMHPLPYAIFLIASALRVLQHAQKGHDCEILS